MDHVYLNALPFALIVLNRDFTLEALNPQAQLLLSTSEAQAIKKPSRDFFSLAKDKEMLLARAFDTQEQLSFYEEPFTTPHGKWLVTLHATPVASPQRAEQLLLTIDTAKHLHNQTASEWKKETTRAAGVMAAMLAHEVKNPLSGIRGAAQLLQSDITPEQQPLAELICRETDRIRDLLDQVEIFSAGTPALQPINIHEVLQYVISIAGAGFARHVRFKEQYDPSLPETASNRELLVQLFLNLVKNAAEAMARQPRADLTISTSYQSGYRIHKEGQSEPVALPLMVSIEDNGPGIPADIRGHLFEPFVSTKEEGRGLGLAVVAKIAADLGLVVELDSSAKSAKFNVMLPLSR